MPRSLYPDRPAAFLPPFAASTLYTAIFRERLPRQRARESISVRARKKEWGGKESRGD